MQPKIPSRAIVSVSNAHRSDVCVVPTSDGDEQLAH